jgi:cobalt-zinc-cadmium efflux system protein
MDVATAHLVTEAGDPEQVLAAARAVLHDQFAIAHATLQVETTRDRQCSGVNW